MELNNQNSFGIGEGELIEIIYEQPLPMRLDRWLVSKRPEQSRARIQHFINSGLVLVNYKTAKAKTPLKNGDNVQIWMPPPEPLIYLKPEKLDLSKLYPLSTKIRMRISQLNKYLTDMELILPKALRVLLLGSTKQLQNIPQVIKGESVSYTHLTLPTSR